MNKTSNAAPPSVDGQLWRLTASYALAFTSASLTVTASGLLGRQIAPSPALATLPLSLQLIAMMATGIPASLLMARIGRKRGFQVGLSIGVLGGLSAALAGQGFAFLLAGSVGIGIMLGFTQQLRFAAAEITPERASRAVSRVLIGGIVAAIIGPNLAFALQNGTDTPFGAAFLAVAIMAVLAMLMVQTVSFAPMQVKTGNPPPAQALLRKPILIGVAVAMLGYGTMSLIMTATPLAMVDSGYSVKVTSRVIMAHGIAMFAPSFFTGRLIERFGLGAVMAAGWMALLGASVTSLLSGSLAAFTVALILLGLGWNGLFVGGTTMVANAQRPGEAARLQGANDFFVLGTAAAGSLLSGVAIAAIGWTNLQMILVAVIIAAGAILWLGANFGNTGAAKSVA